MNGQERTALFPDYHLEDAFVEGNQSKVKSYVMRMAAIFLHHFEANRFEELGEVYRAQERLTERVARRAEKMGGIYYFVGFFWGVMEAVKAVLVYFSAQKLSGEAILEGSEKDIHRKKQILYYIEKHDGVRHGAMATALGIDKSTLTGIMNQLTTARLVDATSPGKFKYYYLTNLGKQYCDQNRPSQKRQGELEDALKLLIEILEDRGSNNNVMRLLFSLNRQNSLNIWEDSTEKLLAVKDVLNQTDAIVTVNYHGIMYDLEVGKYWADLPSDGYPKGRLIMDVDECIQFPFTILGSSLHSSTQEKGGLTNV